MDSFKFIDKCIVLKKKVLKIILWFLLVASLSHYKILNSHRQVGETKLRH
jgi:hypothetical protein